MEIKCDIYSLGLVIFLGRFIVLICMGLQIFLYFDFELLDLGGEQFICFNKCLKVDEKFMKYRYIIIIVKY